MKYIFHIGQKAPEFLIWANFKWGSGIQSTDTADKIEESILRILNPRHIVNSLHRDLWDDINESKENERGRTFIRVLTVKKMVNMLKNDPLFLELFIIEFDKIELDGRRLKAIMNYNTYLKNDKWISPQYNSNDPDLLEKWKMLDNFIYCKEQEIRGDIDNALNILENELSDIFKIDRSTDDTKIKEDKKTVKHVSIKCECGGRYTQHNHFKHIRTDRHIRHRGGKILDTEKEKNILCECGETINKYQYPRHIQLLTHINKIKEGKNNLVIQIDD